MEPEMNAEVNNDEEGIAMEYIKELEDYLVEAKNKCEKLKTVVSKRSHDAKTLRKAARRCDEALKGVENSRKSRTMEILSCISEMERVSLESQELVKEFRKIEKFCKQSCNMEIGDSDEIVNVVEEDGFLTKMLEKIVHVGEETMKMMRDADKAKEESKSLDREIVNLQLRMTLLKENEEMLKRLEGNLQGSDNGPLEFEMECDAQNSDCANKDDFADLMENLDVETKKNVELQNEYKETKEELSKLEALSHKIDVLKELSEMSAPQIMSHDLNEILREFPELGDEIVRFKNSMSKLKDKKASQQSVFNLLQSSYNENSKKLDNLRQERKRLQKTVSELKNEVDCLKEQAGDKAYMLDNSILDKLRLDSTMLEECVNVTKQIEDEKK
uniref:Uncharacterized protein n=1 Tax=Strongyloides venezuelensis TaxID=75913 RepID=A0A0K0FDL1_STRVS